MSGTGYAGWKNKIKTRVLSGVRMELVMVCLLASDGQTVECMTVQAAREFLTGPRHTTDILTGERLERFDAEAEV